MRELSIDCQTDNCGLCKGLADKPCAYRQRPCECECHAPRRDRPNDPFVANYCERFGYSPTVRECGQVAGLKSSTSAQKRLDRLVAAGKLERQPLPRTLRIKA